MSDTAVTWHDLLASELARPAMHELNDALKRERATRTIYPPAGLVFNALKLTPFSSVNVVILGQDPYHGPHQAHGLCFSVPHGVPKPPSLKNIFTELSNDIGIPEPSHGCLEAWARQGVLLLNAVLTVEAGKPASHAGRGWEEFTDAAIRAVNARRPHVAFVLWGAYAQRKAAFVDRSRHLVVASPHPSPYSAANGFFGSRPFSKVNAFLNRHGLPEVDWRTDEPAPEPAPQP